MKRPMRRLVGPALVAAAALLAAGCSSGGDEPDEEQTDPSDAAAEESADAADTEDGAGEGSGRLDPAFVGIWAAESGDALLHLGSDSLATLILDTEACLGAASGAAGQTVVQVQCAGDSEYGTGRAETSDQVLTITWENGGSQQYQWVADSGIELSGLDLGDLGIEDLDDFRPEDLDLGGVDLGELEGLLPGGSTGSGGN